MNFDVGHVFSSERGGDGWEGGILIGREIVKGWEVDGEVHWNFSNYITRHETIVNIGTRIDLSENLTLMLALGKDVDNNLGPKASVLSYIGFQLRL
jgi:hypothetical protein